MTIQRFCHGFCLATGLILATAGTQSTIAETFSFNLKGLGESDLSGSRIIRGTMTLDGEEGLEPQTLDFEMGHGDGENEQSLDMAIRSQGESILEAVFDIFGLESRGDGDKFDANVSGEINPTDSEVNVSLGEEMPGLRIQIKTPQN